MGASGIEGGGGSVPGLLQIDDGRYVVVPVGMSYLESIGLSTLSSSDILVIAGVSGADSPSLAEPSFYIVDLDRLTEMGWDTGALEGLSKEEGKAGYLFKLNVEKFAMSIEEHSHDIKMSMLEKWIDSIKEIDELRRRDAIEDYKKILTDQNYDQKDINQTTAKIAGLSPYQAAIAITGSEAYQAWAETLPPLEKTQELNKANNYVMNAALLEGTNNYLDRAKSGEATAIPFVMASLAIAATFMADYVSMIGGAVETAAQGSVSAVLQGVNQVGAPILEQNLAFLGFLGGMFAVGTMYKTGDQVALNAGKAPKEEVDKQFAREYGKNIIALIEDDDFNGFVNSALIVHVKDGHTMPADQRAELQDAIKLVLLSVALAAIYKAEHGKITQEEFYGMLSDERMTKDDPIKIQLKGLIAAYVAKLTTLKSSMVDSILEYLESDPELEEMFDVTKVFAGIRETESFTSREVASRQPS